MKYMSLIWVLMKVQVLSASCGYTFNSTVLNYTSGSSNPLTNFNYSVTRPSNGQGSCRNLLMGFSKGSSSGYNRTAYNASTGSTISYNIYRTNSTSFILKKIIDASSPNELLSTSIRKNETQNMPYYFQLGNSGTSFLPRAGTYTDAVLIEAYPGTFGYTGPLDSTRPLAVNIIIPKSISLSLVDRGGTYDPLAVSKVLDFGELTAGQELGLDIRILSNAGYQLSVSSNNNQVLQLLGTPNNLNSEVRYDFYANGSLKNLSTSKSSPVMLASGVGSTLTAGEATPIRIVIKNVDNKFFGIYQDYLTFTVATTE